MLNILKQLVKDTNSRVIVQVLKKKSNKSILEWIMLETAILNKFNVTIKERIYYILTEKPNVICENGKKRTLSPTRNEYGFCSNAGSCVCLQEYQTANYIPRDMKHVAEARKKTWIKNYGVDNPSKVESIKEKRKITILSRNYNHTRNKLSHDKETKGYHQVIDRVKNVVVPLFNREEYHGTRRHHVYTWQCCQCDQTFESHIDSGETPRCSICFPLLTGTSKAEVEIAQFVESLGMKIITNTKKIIPPLELDIFIPEKNIAIEYNGIYWHSSELKPKDYHVNKYLKCKESGIHLVQIFEDEWIRSSEIVKNRLRNLFGISKKFWARHGNVKEISSKEYREFTINHHLRGYAPASIKYGIFIQDKLVSIMSFSKSRYTSTGFELVRYCSDGTVIGGAGKLLNHFKKIHQPDEIVTYADRCWSNGNLYRQLGFTDVTVDQHNTGYWYIKNGIRYHRSNFTKSKLISIGHSADQTETTIMNQLGYIKIHDCGNYKFIWKSE